MGHTRDSIVIYNRIYISLCMARGIAMRHLSAFDSIIGTALCLAFITVVEMIIVAPLEQQLYEERRINAYTVNQFNKMSTKAKKLQDRVEELESANEAMMQHCTPSSVVRAIKATPLPAMKG